MIHERMKNSLPAVGIECLVAVNTLLERSFCFWYPTPLDWNSIPPQYSKDLIVFLRFSILFISFRSQSLSVRSIFNYHYSLLNMHDFGWKDFSVFWSPRQNLNLQQTIGVSSVCFLKIRRSLVFNKGLENK